MPAVNHRDTAELVRAFREKWGRLKVDIGCGTQIRGEDFIGVDRHAGETLKTMARVEQGDGTVKEALVEIPLKADVKADMWALPFDDGSVDELWCSHALEHVPMAKVIDTLKEFHRILKRGGRAIITVPDFDYIAKYWLCGTDRRWAEQMVMGMQNSEGEFHRACFNAELLQGDLQGAGFKVKVLKVVWTHGQQCLQAVVLKEHPVELIHT